MNPYRQSDVIAQHHPQEDPANAKRQQFEGPAARGAPLHGLAPRGLGAPRRAVHRAGADWAMVFHASHPSGMPIESSS